MITKKQLKNEIGTLREDMAAEFVKRDTVIEAHTAHLETFHNLIHGWAKDLADLSKKVEDIIDAGLMNKLFVYGLIKACGVTADQIKIAARYVDKNFQDYKDGKFIPYLNEQPNLFTQAEEKPKVERLEGNDWMYYVSAKVLMETLGLKHKNAWYYAMKYGIHTKKDEKGHNWYCFADVRRAKEEREAKAKK